MIISGVALGKPALVFAEPGQPGDFQPFTLVCLDGWINYDQVQEGDDAGQDNGKVQHKAYYPENHAGPERLNSVETNKGPVFWVSTTRAMMARIIPGKVSN